MAAALLLCALLAHILPETLAAQVGGTRAAWEFVGYGVEATALWLAVASLAWRVPGWWARIPIWAVCLYGVFESVQRPICRLALPMDRAPKLEPGQFLCDAAGWRTEDLSFAAILLVAAVVAYRPCKA